MAKALKTVAAFGAVTTSPAEAVGTRISGRPYGVGHSQPALSLVLAMMIRMYVQEARRSNEQQQAAAVFLRRVLVEGIGVEPAAAEAGIHERAGFRLVSGFRAAAAIACTAEEIGSRDLLDQSLSSEAIDEGG